MQPMLHHWGLRRPAHAFAASLFVSEEQVERRETDQNINRSSDKIAPEGDELNRVPIESD